VDVTETAKPPPTTKLLGTCQQCESPLPLRHPQPGEQALQWECTQCGRTYLGILLDDWPAEFQGNVRAVAPPAAAKPSSPLETDLSRELDAKITQGLSLDLQPRGRPFAEQVQSHGAKPYDARTQRRFIQLIHRTTEQLRGLFSTLAMHGAAQLDVADSISRNGLSRVAEDRDLLVYVGATQSWGDFPARHAVRVSMLAMSVGTALGWDEQTLLNLGTGCLVHDAGLLSIESATDVDEQQLSDDDFAEIVKHPLLTFELLKPYMDRIPAAVRMVAYEMHERCDGSGYPRGYRGSRIHALAKIAAVAEVFISLVSTRSNRPAMAPYEALSKILHDTRDGLFDPQAVRGLLNTVSLFPIGSHVSLNDGRVGRVIRTTAEEYDRPIVEVWRGDEPPSNPGVIDLSRRGGLAITGALAGTGS